MPLALDRLEGERLVAVLADEQELSVRQRQQIVARELEAGLRVLFEQVDQRMRFQACRRRLGAHSPQAAGAAFHVIVEHPGGILGRRQRDGLLGRQRQCEVGKGFAGRCLVMQRHPVELCIERPGAAMTRPGVEYPQPAIGTRREIDRTESRRAGGRLRPQQAARCTAGVQVKDEQTRRIAQAGDEVAGRQHGEAAQVGYFR